MGAGWAPWLAVGELPSEVFVEAWGGEVDVAASRARAANKEPQNPAKVEGPEGASSPFAELLVTAMSPEQATVVQLR